MLIFEPRSPGSKVHPDLVVSPPRDRLESNEVRTKLLPLPPLALEDDELMLAIESNPNSHETDDNSYTEDFSSEEKSSENQARLAEQNYHNQNGPEITVISNSNVAEPSSTIQQNENNSGGYSANTEEDGYRYSDEENTRENGYGGRGKNAITKSTDYKSQRGQNLNYHHDKDVLGDINQNYPSTSTNQELEEKMRNGMKIRRTFLQ